MHPGALPTIPSSTVVTDQQLRMRELFTEAALFAKSVIANPEYNAAYQQKQGAGQTAYNIAFRDYLKAPQVTQIDTTAYTGLPAPPFLSPLKTISEWWKFRSASIMLPVS